MTACRHCPAQIHQLDSGIWVDDNGFTACVKAPLETVGHGGPAGFVLHEPMPQVQP